MDAFDWGVFAGILAEKLSIRNFSKKHWMLLAGTLLSDRLFVCKFSKKQWMLLART